MAADFWGTGSGLKTASRRSSPRHRSGASPAEAHNDYPQLAVEGGVLMGVPILIAIAGFVIAVRRRLAASSGSAYWVRLGAVALHEERYRSG